MNVKLLILVSSMFCLLVMGSVLLVSGHAFTEKPGNYVLVKVYENLTFADGSARVYIVYGPGDSEEVKLKKANHKNLDENGELTLEALEKVKAQGYELISTHGGDNLQTFVFAKP